MKCPPRSTKTKFLKTTLTLVPDRAAGSCARLPVRRRHIGQPARGGGSGPRRVCRLHLCAPVVLPQRRRGPNHHVGPAAGLEGEYPHNGQRGPGKVVAGRHAHWLFLGHEAPILHCLAHACDSIFILFASIVDDDRDLPIVIFASAGWLPLPLGRLTCLATVSI